MKHASIVLLGVILFILGHNTGTGQNTITFADSFSQGNTNGWTWKTGSWTFADSLVSTNAQFGHHFLIQPHYIFSNVIFQADVMKLVDGDYEHPALVFRWINDTMNYVFRINGVGSQSWIQLMRDLDNRDQNGQVIATVPWYTDENDHRMYKGVWYTMKVQTDTSSIKCKVWRTSDVEPATWNLDVTDSLYTEGEIGLEYYTGAHRFDNVVVIGTGSFVTGIPENIHSNPVSYALGQNYPNPFNPTTVIKYSMPEQSRVILGIYNALGQRVALLVNEVQDAGFREVTFDGSRLSSGVYFYRLQAGSFIDTKKILLLK